MKRLLLLALAVSLPTAPVRATDMETGLTGRWVQIHSNAGRCDRCHITIAHRQGGLTIMANNGWDASVYHIEKGRPLQAYGGWNRSAGSLSEVRFQATFALQGNELHMTMTAKDRDRRARIIRAVYERQ